MYFKGTFHEAKIKEVATISVNTVSINAYLKLKLAFCGRNTKEERLKRKSGEIIMKVITKCLDKTSDQRSAS